MKSKKFKYRAYSVKLSNVNGNFQEYDITEDKFSELSIEKMLKYILYNNKNINEFNRYFYQDLYNLKDTLTPISVVASKSRRSKKKTKI